MRFPLALALALVFLPSLQAADPGCYELRTYHAAEGKLEALHSRFRDHTLALFEKHGMKNLAYWVPEPNEGQTLLYLLAYPDKEARETSWKAFLADPAWQAAKAESEKDGKLVASIESLFLVPTDYSPEKIDLTGEGPRHYEMRHYTTRPGKLGDLDARFRNHTMSLFAKHGMENLWYFHPEAGQANAETTLLYFLAHHSAEAKEASFAAFRSDPDWTAARNASEKDGPILVEKGVVSTALQATDYSPLK